MSLPELLNVPKSESDWQIWSFANRDINNNIRQRIQATTGNITSVVMTSNGSAYTSAPTVIITDLNGTGQGATATATYTVSGGFYNIAVTVVTKGAGYVKPVVSFSGGGGTNATAVAQFTPVVNLPDYQIYPIDFNRFQDFLTNNSQLHDNFNSQLGLQSSDIEELDPKNANQLQNWIYLNYSEIRNACFKLNIS